MIRRSSKTVVRSGFTLMEMMAVVAIIVVMVGAAVPIYLNAVENSKRDRVKADIKTLEDAAARYYMRVGHAPESLQTLTQADDSGFAALPASSLKDPWGLDYVYDAGRINPTTQVGTVYSTKTGPDWR